MKTVKKLLKEYYLLSFVLLSMIVALGLYIGHLHHAANWVIGIAALITVLPLIWDMISTVRGGEYGIDILAATAIISSVALDQNLAAIVIAFMLTGGEALENYAEDRAKTELKTLLDNKPKIAHLIKANQTVEIKVQQVKIGDRLSILSGEVVPVDCQILEGESSIDQSRITGEGVPVFKNVGDNVLSGSVNIDGVLTVKAIHSADDSQYEQIIKLVRSAASSQSPFVRLADRYSIPFTIIAFMIAGAAWFISGQAIRFLEVIVVATPCPLLLAAPIALISGISRSAKQGIIVKTGSALERLAQAQTVAFDKTGTLTSGQPAVDKIRVFGSFSEADVLKWAASLEQKSNHVLADAIVKFANSRKIKLKTAKQIKEAAGLGLSGHIDGKAISVGRWDFINTSTVVLPKNFNYKSVNTTATYVVADHKLAGVITFSDKVRPESKSLIKRLKKCGIEHFLMVTGDNLATAEQVAKAVGIDEVRADCLPADKMKVIDEVNDRPLVFVGDGVNDAPVLTLADVGIALGASGSTAASESADVVIMLDDVSKVASAIEIARRTFAIARQSILAGIIISIGLMFVFASGHFKPVYGALIQEVVDVIVIFNALRAHSAWQNRADKKT